MLTQLRGSFFRRIIVTIYLSFPTDGIIIRHSSLACGLTYPRSGTWWRFTPNQQQTTWPWERHLSSPEEPCLSVTMMWVPGWGPHIHSKMSHLQEPSFMEAKHFFTHETTSPGSYLPALSIWVNRFPSFLVQTLWRGYPVARHRRIFHCFFVTFSVVFGPVLTSGPSQCLPQMVQYNATSINMDLHVCSWTGSMISRVCYQVHSKPTSMTDTHKTRYLCSHPSSGI